MKDETAQKLNKKEIRRLRSEIVTEKGRILNPLEEQIQNLENEIDASEKQLVELGEDMQTATADQAVDQIKEISQAMHHCQARIDALFDELEVATETYESQSAHFEQKLEELEKKLVG